MEPLAIATLDYVRTYSGDILRARSAVEDCRRRLEEQYGRQIRSTPDQGYDQFCIKRKAILSAIPISTKPGANEPWRQPFSSMIELRREEHFLFVACYIVVAWLTGMRDSEITSIRKGRLCRERDADGMIERYKIRATLFKNIPDRKGREETWVAIEPVAQAVEILERLTEPLRRQSGKNELFLASTRGFSVPSTPAINVALRDFAEHGGALLVEGKPWRLSTRQFRRTLARWIARRPCQQHVPEKDRHAPVTSHCHPNLCPNSCITKEHLPAWEAQLLEIQRLRKGPKLSEPQRVALDQEKAKIERIIAPLRKSGG